MKKAVLINLPLTATLYPSASLAAIIPIFKSNNYEVEVVDLNLELTEEFLPEEVDSIYSWCELTLEELDTELMSKLTKWVNYKIEQLPFLHIDLVGVSVFSIYSIKISKLFFELFKKQNFQGMIIAGGNGVSSDLSAITNFKSHGEDLLDNKLVDHVIFGEGEISLEKLLQGQHHAGIDTKNPTQIEDLEQLAKPDYTNFDFDRYKDQRLLITGSRGCVRKCTFCDIELTWPKFRQRSAQSIFDEIIEHKLKYNINKFEFTDSLINGSVSEWIKFNDLLANAKAKDRDLEDISYTGQFICRDEKNQKPVMYELMHYAGCKQITVGIESFSESIRNDMKKKFSNQAIEYHLEQCAKWAIPNVFLMIVGYPTETIADHQSNLDAVKKYKIYSDMGIIFMIRWGLTMHIYKDTPLFKSAQDYKIDILKDNNMDALYSWTSDLNPGLDYLERVRRRIELHELSYNLGYHQPNTRNELQSMLSLLNEYDPQPNKKTWILNQA